MGSAVVIVLLVASLIGLAVGGGNGRSARAIPVAQPAFTSTVARATKAAGGAAFTLVVRSPGLGCGSSTSDQASENQGSVDCVNQMMKYSTTTPGCPATGEPLTIQTPLTT